MANKIISLHDKKNKKQPKSSRKVVLIATCALTAAAIGGGYWYYQSRQNEFVEEKVKDDNIYQNNTFLPGRGYYHSSAMTWYPYPWGTYDSNRGYFYDGQWSSAQRTAPAIPQSMPLSIARKTSDSSSSSSSSSSSGSSSTKRSGFGSSSNSSSIIS